MFYGKFDEAKREAFNQSIVLMNEMFGRVYAQDNLIAIRKAVGFWQDPDFAPIFERHAKSDKELSLAWRLHTLTWAADHCLTIPGDFVECGVFRGFSMAVVADYLKFETVDRTMYLYDTFEGIPDEMNSEKRSNLASERENAAGKDTLVSYVRSVFAKYSNVKVIQGTVPHSFEQACPDKVAFLHLDMNSSKSEIAALDVLFDRMSPGGIAILDDYGWIDYLRQRVAEDAYMKSRNHKILELPTGQGMLIKK